ncbi:hypothetical protein T281_11195 [Rhodomicrobium udaipurense JA643]|uniref:MHYT domain-containing protein n=1 Tax=Rhodomicrobium udaipurense TaxID=1202716 RepID=A0A8I1GIS3_9HYPH|nr:MHYT domain-containing protein [Rhodomicrobium udaipurense]KAI94393.1 hypothetical protein T281_11195 [Rhodomicrobium udaipurense JA643]MBJ7544580.1 hypothetical protein [Rhodomicrobium udaipurense]
MAIPHETELVILSVAISLIGALTAAILMSNLDRLRGGERRVRLLMAGLVLGGAIWTTHFVGLLALESPVNLEHNPELLALSALAAFSGTTAALLLVGIRPEAAATRLPLAATLLGFTLVLTNYSGLAAVAGREQRLSWFLTVIGVAISIQAAIVALWLLLRIRLRGIVLTSAGAVALGIVLSSTHYMAVASTMRLDETLAALPRAVEQTGDQSLAWTATIALYVVCSVCLCVFVLSQFRSEQK